MNLLKIDIPGKDCKNIYYIADDQIPDGVITNSKITFKTDYKLLVRVTVVIGTVRKNKRKVVKFNKNQTLLRALERMYKERHVLKEQVVTGNIEEKPNRVLTLNEKWDRYLESKKHELSSQTYKTYDLFYKNHLKKLGRAPMPSITTEQLQEVVNKLLTEPKNDDGDKRSPRTAKTLKEILRPVFNDELNHRYSCITHNPVLGVKIPKFDNTMQIDLTFDQIRELNQAIRAYNHEPYRSIFIWGTYGRRLNEVLSLRWEHINLEKMTYDIVAANNKARKNMTYSLSDELYSTLKVAGIRKNGFVFPSIKDPDKKMHSGTLKRHWKEILEDAGIEKLRLHDLRHILGGELVSNGASLEQVAAVLGHTSTAITKRYSEVRREVADEALSDFFGRINS